MLVLIDESGCPGFKLGKGSSKLFVASMVIFRDYQEAERASKAIGDLRAKLGIRPEFKFSRCSANIKDQFFDVIADYNFEVRAIVVQKDIVYSKGLRSDAKRFYSYFVKSMLHHDGGSLSSARVKIDGSGSRPFKRALATYLRSNLAPGKVRSFRAVDSKNDNLIQLADMCAGAIARSCRSDRKGDPGRWRAKLGAKVRDVWHFV